MKRTLADNRLYTIGEIANYLGCTPRHVQNLIGAGLPHLKLGRLLRFDPGEVLDFLRRHRQVAGR